MFGHGPLRDGAFCDGEGLPGVVEEELELEDEPGAALPLVVELPVELGAAAAPAIPAAAPPAARAPATIVAPSILETFM